MKKRYTWDDGLLKKYKANPEMRKELKDLFQCIEKEQEIIIPRYMKVLKDDIDFFHLNTFVYPKFNSILNDDINYLNIQKSKTKISLEEAFRLTNSFYGSLDSDIVSAFKIHYNNRFTHIKELSSYEDFFSGECYFLEKAKDCLIEIRTSKDFAMLGALIHEYGHAIAFTLRDYNIANPNNAIFFEIESIFMELVAYHFFIKNNTFKKEAHNEMIILYNDIIDVFKSTIEVHEICLMAKELDERKKALNMHNIIKEARLQFTDMTSLEVKNLLKCPIEMQISYGYSYLIAVELYEVYLKNPEYALQLYKKIIKLQKNTALETYQAICKMGINVGEHFEEFTNSLKR